MTNDMPELKPCPFCGGEARLSEQPSKDILGWSNVHCVVCSVSTPALPPASRAIERWNTRADTPTSDERKAALDDLCSEFGCPAGIKQMDFIRAKLRMEQAQHAKIKKMEMAILLVAPDYGDDEEEFKVLSEALK